MNNILSGEGGGFASSFGCFTACTALVFETTQVLPELCEVGGY